MFSQIKDIKNIEQNFHLVAWVMPQRWDLGVPGVNNSSVGICDGAPSTAGSSYYIIIFVIFAGTSGQNCFASYSF